MRPLPGALLLATLLTVTAVLTGAAVSAQPRTPAYIGLGEARSLASALPPASRPADLPAAAATDAATRWRGWVSSHDQAIRRRLADGDEDTVLNWLLLGRTFTALPPASSADLARARIDPFILALEASGTDERRRFARRHLERRGLRFGGTAADRDRARAYLLRALEEMLAAPAARAAAGARQSSAAPASAFDQRGLSLDTSLQPNFAIEQSLQAAKARGTVAAGAFRRIGIIGAGLDFADKNSGFDFYPVQTVQPFALLDTLQRLGLAAAGTVEIVALDSPRVLEHVRAARASRNYVIQLPLAETAPWSLEFRRYWATVGTQVGSAVAANGPAGVAQRAVRVAPAALATLGAEDLNIIVQRQAGASFDLVVATNVLVYYAPFEQAMAMANIAAMLGPRGLFLTNTTLPAVPAAGLARAGSQVTLYTTDGRGDEIIWYRRAGQP